MTTVTIDPMTRIEGHLKIEMKLKEVATVGLLPPPQYFVDKAKCSGELFRGFEIFLKGKHPVDAWLVTQRICGVCPTPHGTTSILALEDAYGVEPPTAAILLRNIINAAHYVTYDALLHFYLLIGPELGVLAKYPPMVPPALGIEGIKKLKLGSSYAKNIELQRESCEIMALFGGKFPLEQSHYPGGSVLIPSLDRLSSAFARLVPLWEWIAIDVINDLLAIVKANDEVIGPKLSALLGVDIRGLEDVGVGTGNFLSFGIFPDYTDYADWLDPGKRKKALFRSGAWKKGDTAPGQTPFDPAKIIEYVKYSWYKSPTGLHPSEGETDPQKPKPEAYSWLKAPRYDGRVYEAGPMARMMNTYGLKWGPIKRIHPITGEDFGDITWKVRNPNGSVLDRVAARVLQCLIVTNKMFEWILALKDYVDKPAIHYKDVPESATGVGLWEAPRGALGHWLTIKGKKIDRYQVITPTAWNASPRDDEGRPGAIETALQHPTTWIPKGLSVPAIASVLYPEKFPPDTPIVGGLDWGEALAAALGPLGLAKLNIEVADGIEWNTSVALTIIRSFDPCLACAVHLITPEGKRHVIELNHHH